MLEKRKTTDEALRSTIEDQTVLEIAKYRSTLTNCWKYIINCLKVWCRRSKHRFKKQKKNKRKKSFDY